MAPSGTPVGRNPEQEPPAKAGARVEGSPKLTHFWRAGQDREAARPGKAWLRVLTSCETQSLLPRKSLSGSKNKAPTMVTAAATKNDERMP
ncbi:MAG: hypothetical protein HYW03_18820 [Deltaproteobacteria bacterium]|nr:hypothetical protein [Deltaproteobacteria bacterium]